MSDSLGGCRSSRRPAGARGSKGTHLVADDDVIGSVQQADTHRQPGVAKHCKQNVEPSPELPRQAVAVNDHVKVPPASSLLERPPMLKMRSEHVHIVGLRRRADQGARRGGGVVAWLVTALRCPRVSRASRRRADRLRPDPSGQPPCKPYPDTLKRRAGLLAEAQAARSAGARTSILSAIAASTTRRSAPPSPRSGCRKAMRIAARNTGRQWQAAALGLALLLLHLRALAEPGFCGLFVVGPRGVEATWRCALAARWPPFLGEGGAPLTTC